MAKQEYTIGDHNQKSQHAPGPGPGRHGMGPGEKANNFGQTMKKLVAYCSSYIPVIIIALVLAFAGAALNVIGPDQLSEITDIIQKGMMTEIDLDAVRRVGMILAILYGLGLLFNYIQGFMMATVTQRITKKMRTDISLKINKVPLKYFDSTSYGNVLSRVTNDVDTIGQTLNNSLGMLVSSVATFIGAIIMMFYTNWIMAITGIMTTMIGFLLMTLIMKHSQKYFGAQQQELGLINGHIEEVYAGHNVVKVYNGEKEAKEVFQRY